MSKGKYSNTLPMIVHTHTRTHAHTHTRTHTRTYTHIHTRTHMRAYTQNAKADPAALPQAKKYGHPSKKKVPLLFCVRVIYFLFVCGERDSFLLFFSLLSFQGDDETYLYINGQLVLEVSGIDWCVDIQSEFKGTSVTVRYNRICPGPAIDRVIQKQLTPMIHGQNYRLEWFHVQRKVDCSHHAAVFGIIPTCPPGSAGQKCNDDTGCYQWFCNAQGHCEKSAKPGACSPSGNTCTKCDLTSPTGACIPERVCTQPNGRPDQCKLCSGASACTWAPAYTNCNDNSAQTCEGKSS